MTDPYSVRIIKRPLSGRGLGHVTKFRNFGIPYNFWKNRDTSFKFGTDIEDGTILRPDHKSGRGLGHVTKFRNFGTPLITLERIEISASNFGIDIDDGPRLRPDHKMNPKWAWPGSRDRILHSKDELLTSHLMLHQRQMICLLIRTKQQI